MSDSQTVCYRTVLGGAGECALVVLVLLAAHALAEPPSSSDSRPAPGDQQDSEHQDSEAPDEARIAHGKYLVHHVAKCVECHSPRDPHGRLLATRLLRGATIPVAGPTFERRWAVRAPKLAGMPAGWNETQLVTLLTSGRPADGDPLRPPMPRFGLSPEDAAAVVAYLKSLD